MQIPAAAFIEQAMDGMNRLTLTVEQMSAHRRELSAATGFTSIDYVRGYLLGIQTARVMIAASVAVQQSNIKPEDIL